MPDLTGVLILLALLVVLEASRLFLAWRGRRRRLLERAAPVLPEEPARPGAQEGSRAAIVPARRPSGVITLVHGFAGFDEVRVAGKRAAYFRGVRERLEARGFECVVPKLPPVAQIAVRARVLALELERIAAGGRDVHVIAHSMGGLDARYALSTYGARGVRSLVTVATPHRGTPLAGTLARLARAAGFEPLSHALRDLAPERLEALASAMRDARDVRYASVLVAPRAGRVHPLLYPTYGLLARKVGDNDGLVPVASQAWGEIIGEADTDHWGVVGWGGAFDAAAFYDALVLALPRLVAAHCSPPRLSAA
jgi:triacylglycerol lipase